MLLHKFEKSRKEKGIILVNVKEKEKEKTLKALVLPSGCTSESPGKP